MFKIEPAGMKATKLCEVCGQRFEYVSDGQWIPTSCPDCPSLFEAMEDLKGPAVDIETDRTEREIWTTGRHGATVCLTIDEYDDGSIIASAEADHVTDFQIERALREAYPVKAFRLSRRHGYVYAASI